MPRRPRILLAVHSAQRGGAEAMALAEARHLHDTHDLVISVPDGPLRCEFSAYGEVLDAAGTLPLWGDSAKRWALGTLRTASGAVRLAREIRRHRVEAVLTNSSVSLAPVIAGRLTGASVVVHVRDVPASRLSPAVFWAHGALADTVIVIADAMARRFDRAARARVVRIAEGIAMHPPPDVGPLRSAEAPLQLCLVGGIDPRKGQDIAVEAVARLRDRGVSTELELIGREIDAGYAASVRDRIARLRLGDRVRFAGEADDARAALGRADVVVAPSRSEWTPLSLMEAMACERPVVAARVGGIPEMVSGRAEVAMLTPPEDPEALARAVATLARDPARARAMGRRARRHAATRFDIARALDALREEVDRAVAVNRRERARARLA